jgi:hypothetical protein
MKVEYRMIAWPVIIYVYRYRMFDFINIVHLAQFIRRDGRI